MKKHAGWIGPLFFVIGMACAAGAIEACGSSSDDTVGTPPPADATSEATVVEDAVSEATPDAVADATFVKEGGWVCDPNVDFTDKIPDLPVGNGKTTGECVDCLKAECAAPIKQCNLDCDCQAPIGNLLVCAVGAGFDQTALLGCVSSGGFLNTTSAAQTEGLSILTCMQRKCGDPCIPAAPDASASSDSGAGDASSPDAQ